MIWLNWCPKLSSNWFAGGLEERLSRASIGSWISSNDFKAIWSSKGVREADSTSLVAIGLGGVVEPVLGVLKGNENKCPAVSFPVSSSPGLWSLRQPMMADLFWPYCSIGTLRLSTLILNIESFVFLNLHAGNRLTRVDSAESFASPERYVK